ncbi:hypothetical protein L226DRAFT_540679 [Lentinus tigrinus ALCF2SS1-7]|uniref:uncharacterized protein n=1 Tax=Lentinus tigrinus ALCF2SS1-7 TaxID=1328758 RepID=UPI0011662486|nr:hypothetical protein L226DRAFT_540679 [Lentinus tigrinus ALCF2SS1-7]
MSDVYDYLCHGFLSSPSIRSVSCSLRVVSLDQEMREVSGDWWAPNLPPPTSVSNRLLSSFVCPLSSRDFPGVLVLELDAQRARGHVNDLLVQRLGPNVPYAGRQAGAEAEGEGIVASQRSKKLLYEHARSPKHAVFSAGLKMTGGGLKPLTLADAPPFLSFRPSATCTFKPRLAEWCEGEDYARLGGYLDCG